MRLSASITLLILVNLIPVIGVLTWNWDLGTLLVLYWLESLIIGFFNLFKISQSKPEPATRIWTSLFFTFHYGIFWIVHGVFLIAMLIPKIDAANPDLKFPFASLVAVNLKWVLLAFFLSHGFSYLRDYLTIPESERRTTIAQMFVPYGRVLVLHIVILLGAFLLAEKSRVVEVLLLFTGAKIVLDLVTYFIVEHRLG